jgi:hypothetical protein
MTPYLLAEFDEAFWFAAERGVLVERNLELRICQFFDYVEHVPPVLLVISRVLDCLNVNVAAARSSIL